MIPAGIVAAFAAGLAAALTLIGWLDRRAICREAEFWEQLRMDALEGYGRVFDWAAIEDEA